VHIFDLYKVTVGLGYIHRYSTVWPHRNVPATPIGTRLWPILDCRYPPWPIPRVLLVGTSPTTIRGSANHF
jgi:hypothetical protein